MELASVRRSKLQLAIVFQFCEKLLCKCDCILDLLAIKRRRMNLLISDHPQLGQGFDVLLIKKPGRFCLFPGKGMVPVNAFLFEEGIESLFNLIP